MVKRSQNIIDQIIGMIIAWVVISFLTYMGGILLKIDWLTNLDLTSPNFGTLTPWIYILLFVIIIILFVIISKKKGKKGKGYVISIPQNKPKVVDEVLEVHEYGVKWRVLVGRAHRFSEDRIYYVDECLCPKDDCELMKEINNWRCPHCKNTYLRPKKFRNTELEAIRKIAKRDYEKLLKNKSK